MNDSHLDLYQKSFIPRGSKLWNSLPVGLKEAEKIGLFKKQLKKWVTEIVPMFEDGPLILYHLHYLHTKALERSTVYL